MGNNDIGITLGFTLPEACKGKMKGGKKIIDSVDKYVSVDLETTGLDAYFDSIIECAAIRYENGAEVGRFSSLVNPGCSIDPFISDLTGITNEMLSAAPCAEEVLPRLVEFIGTDVILGHNIRFDLRFLESAGYFLENDYIDTMGLSRRLWPEFEHHRLCDLRERLLQGPAETAHRGAEDAEIAAACYECMKTHCAEIGIEMRDLAKHAPKLRAADIIAQNDNIDPTTAIYGRTFVFTGTLSNMQRKDAMQLVVDRGGICGDNVTAKTNFLVLGAQDYKKVGEGGKSSKHKKAENLKLAGQDIEIISENVFAAMIEDADV